MDLLSENEWLAERAAEILKAIAHPLRLRIVAALAGGDSPVGALAERLGVKQPILSQQLRILRMRGLVEFSRSNGQAVYRLSEPHLNRMLRCVEGCLLSRPDTQAAAARAADEVAATERGGRS